MPDFEVNEGYIEAARRRADSSLPGVPDEQALPPEHPLDGLLLWIEGPTLADGLEGQLEQVAEGPDPAPLQRKLPEVTPVVRRVRQRAFGHLTPPGRPARVGVKLIARRRASARQACPCGWQVRVLSVPPRERRRLWTTCH